MSQEAKNLEPTVEPIAQPVKTFTWKNKVFNFYLVAFIWSVWVCVQGAFDKRPTTVAEDIWYAVICIFLPALFGFCYLRSAGFLQSPTILLKADRLEKSVENLFEGIFELAFKMIGWGIGIALVGGAIYFIFGAMASLSVSTLLIIIIVLLILK